LALRVLGSNWRIESGRRQTCHPVRPADFWVSLRRQAGNRDDMLMDRVHGPEWRVRAHAPMGRRREHLLVVAAATMALTAAAAGRPALTAAFVGVWTAGTTRFAA